MSKVCALGFTRYKQDSIISISFAKGPSESLLSKEAQIILSSLKQTELSPQERMKLTGVIQTGEPNLTFTWHCLRDEQDLLYIVATEPQFPERQAYQIISELKQNFKNLDDSYGKNEDNLLKLHSRKISPGIIDNHNQGTKNKLGSAQQKVEHTRIQMQSNLDAIIANTDDLEETRLQSDKLKNQANTFQTQTAEVNSIMRWRHIKWIILIIVILLVVGLILFLLLR